MFFYRGYLQGLFIALLVLYVWVLPEYALSGWIDTLADIVGNVSLALGTTLRIWAVRLVLRRGITSPLYH
jgi:hypothetical protein